MKDQYNRNVDYLRISITDRCNLRCRYCMPQGIALVSHDQVLRYGELLRLAGLLAGLGVVHMRVTGGEPLVRRGAVKFIAELKRVPGVQTVSMTTNGVLLPRFGQALKDAGLDAVNISLDTPDPSLAARITGREGTAACVLEGIETMTRLGVPVKLNAVLMRDTAATLPELLRFAERGVPVRLIELMPMGCGRLEIGLGAGEALELMRRLYPDLRPSQGRLGFGPAHYYESARLKAPVGMVDAVSQPFCDGCNRVRLTATGVLKPCLCYGQGTDVGGLMRAGAEDDALQKAMADCIFNKPKQHCFRSPANVTEARLMSQIGG